MQQFEDLWSKRLARPLERVLHVGNRLVGVGWRWMPSRRRWFCPCCGNRSAFAPVVSSGGIRRFARCPHCGSTERHRLGFLACREVVEPHFETRRPRVLHVAPETSIEGPLRAIAGSYETGDLFMPSVDHRIDLTSLPFDDACFDLVWASHVLAVIRDDRAALSEIRRILRPGGMAVLPIPIVGERTIDYPTSVAGECDNWHAPGWDYDRRMAEFFPRVTWVRSESAPADWQTFVYEDRSRWPTRAFPYREPTPGDRHPDGIPICWVE